MAGNNPSAEGPEYEQERIVDEIISELEGPTCRFLSDVDCAKSILREIEKLSKDDKREEEKRWKHIEFEDYNQNHATFTQS